MLSNCSLRGPAPVPLLGAQALARHDWGPAQGTRADPLREPGATRPVRCVYKDWVRQQERYRGVITFIKRAFGKR